LIWFYLCLVAVPQVISSTRVNTTSSDGKVFISGDHNEVVVSSARQSKIALAEIKSKLESVEKKDKEISMKLQALDKRMVSLDKFQGNLRAINQTIEALFEKVEKKDKEFSRKLQDLDKRILFTDTEIPAFLNALNQTIETLSKTVETLNKSNARLIGHVSDLERKADNYAILFLRKGISDYVNTSGMPSLKAVTVCLWMKTADKGNEGTLLSYAVPGNANELLLVDYRNFALFVRGHWSRATSVSTNDGKWHHICTTWENTAGSWKLYKDGKISAAGKGLETGHVVRSGGALVLGQDQDSVGGSFQASQSFIGEMTGVNIWDHVIREQEIKRMSKSCLAGVGNVFQWRDFKPHLKGSVKIIKPSC